MNVQEVITKLKVMLGAETETVEEVQLEKTEEVQLEETVEETVESKMAEAELIDGTKVIVDGELEVGKTLLVVPAEGEEPVAAPAGLHETTEGLLIQVGEAGEITSIEEAEAEAVESEEVVEEELAEEGDKKEAEMSAEELVEAIAAMIQPQAEELKNLKEELSNLKERFNVVADQPAAEKVKNTFSQQAADAKSVAEARLERLLQIRKGK